MKKISVMQYKALAFLLPITMFFGVGISNISIHSKESFWLSLIIGIIVGSLIVGCFNKVFRKNNQSLVESAKIKSIFYIIMSLIFIYIGMSILINLITSIYLTEINPILLALPLFALIIYSAFKGKVVVARISVIILVFSLILALSIILSLVSSVQIKNYLPLFNISFLTIFLQGINFAIYSTAPLLLLSLYAPNEVDNIKKNSLLKTYLVSCLMVSIIFILTIGVMGIDIVSLYRYPEYIVLKKVSYFRFLNNIENFNAFFWILTYLILITLSGSVLKESLNNISKSKWFFIGIVLLIFLLIIFTTFKNITFILLLYKHESIILAGLILLFFIINAKK